ncbi:hypothetical protein [Maribacter halichondriae]|uniref:hypothetical protein n=1 Tax=Maribacter halichondriae TaxID=2980554 RepID=UPI00235923F8|nr:hypothetical protein [Maribacter sp. Hal144]
MNFVTQLLPWKRNLLVSIGVLVLLIIFSFYGLYTNKFYFFKFDNYIFPFLTVVHFAFLYVLWFKIKEGEIADPQMRNLEYALYVIFLVYVFQVFDSIYVLTTYSEYENHVIPSTFMPLGILILVLHLLLLGLTLLAFKYRKDLVGGYDFDDMNQHIDSWE